MFRHTAGFLTEENSKRLPDHATDQWLGCILLDTIRGLKNTAAVHLHECANSNIYLTQ